MGPDEDVHIAFLELSQGFLLLLGISESGDHIHFHGVSLESLTEGMIVLLGKDGGGYKYSHLLGIHHCLECRSHGHFRLSVSHISAEQSVHDLGLFHVLLDLF